MTNKQAHKNTTTSGHPDNAHKHTKPMSVPQSKSGEGLQDDRSITNVLDTSSQRREHRDQGKAGTEHHHHHRTPQKSSDVVDSLPNKAQERNTEPTKEGSSLPSTRTSGSFGTADNGSDPMRASTRTRTMSLYEMHAPYMS